MSARELLRQILRLRRRARGGPAAIVLASTALLLYEYVAFAKRRPTVTELSRRWPWAIPIWAWFAALAVHLARAGEPATSTVSIERLGTNGTT